ncbi:hypothetical protein Tsubulata_039358 [Turnera subulata]|uniref:COP1-interacting protein 7 n=1 Tax=Turnera subulata TaxID=218843 RepID=A0A9Q0FHN5_9ROSI|nr:hypothetical protein Tsubulata_039358 [Turnera subulata]
MDSSSLLDYALFQLTPTRTRCDLVIFKGRKNEKLASGLFEPFLSHLKFAQDQISKGGYSIKLCPPSPTAPWFTKGTFERFVRFVSTPAALERFVTLETEISQIESSVQAQESLNTNAVVQPEEGNGQITNGSARKSRDSPKPKSDVERSEDDKPEENSKIQLQRLLETRKMLLCKEQAMAYARGIVAGFEADNLDDLISFADAFGASRLREACINFKELFKKKRGDGRWMEELAAMEACPPPELTFLGSSGVVLSNDVSTLNQNMALNLVNGGTPTCDLDSASKSDSSASHASLDGKNDNNTTPATGIPSATATAQVPMPWPNQIPPYMYNFQSPIQRMPPHQGYPYPFMQPIPAQYPVSMQWPPNMQQSAPAKKKHLNKKASEYSSEETQTESSESELGSDSDSYSPQEKKLSLTDPSYKKKHRKKSSKTVVIRNINYITPKRRNGEKDGESDESSDDDEFIDEDSLKQNVDDAVGRLERIRKSNSSKHRKKGSDKNNGNATGFADTPTQDFHGDIDSNVSKAGETNENWGAFQNLLIRDEETTIGGIERLHPVDEIRSSGYDTSSVKNYAMDLESEKLPKQRMAAGDSFVVTQRNGEHEDRLQREVFENGEDLRPIFKSRASADEDLVIPQRIEESGSEVGHILSSCETKPSLIKPAKGEDWFIVNHSGKAEDHSVSNGHTIFEGACMLPSGDDGSNLNKNRRETLIDDSFMVHDRASADNLYDSQWRTDISMAADLSLSSQPANGNPQEKNGRMDAGDPSDLFMVLERHSGVESVRESWTTDPGMDISFMESERRYSSLETGDLVDKKFSNCDSTTVKKSESNGKRVPSKEVRSKSLPFSLVKNRTEMISRTKKSSVVSRPIVQKSKLEKEEELRKKMEELVLERQKRIAERTAAASKKVSSENKPFKGSSTKDRTHSTTRETNRGSSLKIRAV